MLNVAKGKTELARTGFVTSYPSFRHWRREAMGEDSATRPLNVYLHIPYCIQKCAYCYYSTITLEDGDRTEIDRYVTALCREIALASESFHLKDRPVTTLHFGGGIPTVLRREDFSRIMETLHENLTIADDPEVTVEGEPVTLTQRKADFLQALGVKRISMGIQSFSDEVVGRPGCRDRESLVLRSIEIAKETGAVVNIDLLSGLAGERNDTWEYSIQRTISTAVPSVTVRRLEIYTQSAYYDGLRGEEISIPSEEGEIEKLRYAMDELKKADYLPVHFFNFTKGGGYVKRHTTNIWRGEDLYGFGASASGILGRWSYRNTTDVPRYSRRIETGVLPIHRGYVYSSLDRMVREVLLSMKLIHLNHREFKKRHGFDLLRLCESTLRDLQDSGLITVTDDLISLTDQGILYGDFAGRMLGADLEQLGAEN
ncbi:MAG: coproporphyrinogen III oxidase family protein [bacterium]|nr:coproporphyrinogen III oxidase family protein [bacterium]